MKGAPIALLGLGALLTLAAPVHYRDEIRTANEAARIYTAMAIVQHQTIYLDPVFDRFSPGWRKRAKPPNVDVARRGHHLLLDKAPGVTFLAAPILFAAQSLGLALSYSQLAWLLMLLFSAVPSVAWVLMARRWRGGGERPLLWATVLASPWLIYGGLLFSHALCAALVGVGMALALGRASGSSARPFWGGLVLGFAVLVEYPAALAGATVALGLAANKDKRGVIMLALGSLAPLGLLCAWNTLCFGGPFELGYAYKATATMADTHGQGLWGIALPNPETAMLWLFGSQRGLLFHSPWLTLGMVGAVVAAFDKHLSNGWRVVLPVLTLACPMALTGFGDWHGGLAAGPRYILFTLPAWGLAASLAADRLPRTLRAVVLGFVASSFVFNLLGAYVFPYVGWQVANPLIEINLPVLLHRGGARFAGQWIGFPQAALWIAAGIGAVVLCRASLAWRSDRPRPVIAALFVLGALLLHVAALQSTEPSPPDQVRQQQRSTVQLMFE